MSINIRLLILYFLVHVNAELRPPIADKYALLKTFLDNIELATIETYVTIGVIGVNPEIAQWFISKRIQLNYAVLIWNEENAEVPDYVTYRTKNIFGFIDDVKNFRQYLVYMDDCTFLHRRGNFHFIVGNPVVDDRWLRRVLEVIWIDFRILNFVVAFNMLDTVKIASYNPFNDSVYYLNETDEFFPNKLNNMHGYTLKSSMIEVIPITWKRNGTFFGEDMNQLSKVSSLMNATFITIEAFNHSNAKKMVIQEKVDFAFVKFVVISEIYDVGYSYPLNHEAVVVIVPKSDLLPAYLYIMYIFQPLGWFCICVLSAIFLLINYSRSKVREKLLMYYLVLLMWIAFIVIIPSAFTSGLASTLTKPKYEEEIDTIRELVESNYNIVAIEFIHSVLSLKFPQLKHRFVEVDQFESANRALRGDTDVAFSDSYAVIMQILKQLNERSLQPYHLIKEKFLPGFTSYAFPFRSPYKEEIEKKLQYMFQYRSNTLKLNRASMQTHTHRTLEIVHLQSIFIFMIIGHSLGFIVYLFELIIFKKKRVTKKIKKFLK